MTDLEDIALEEAPIAEPKAKQGDAPRRRADDAPAWAKELSGKLDRLQESQIAAPASDDNEDDDGILSIEELPDLLDDALESVEEAVEQVPEKVHGLFRKFNLFGGKD